MLSDLDILKGLEDGSIIIEPFERGQLGTNSYDVRLAENYWKPNHNMMEVDFTDLKQSGEFWLGPYIATDRISIRPGETILAHTQEVVGGLAGVTTSMRARSSIGRSCLSVCKCAGVGDVGYVGRWTMEITNHSHAIVKLPVGLRVAQILFFPVGEVSGSYMGKYGMSKWDPSDMLPKMYRDTDWERYNPKAAWNKVKGELR